MVAHPGQKPGCKRRSSWPVFAAIGVLLGLLWPAAPARAADLHKKTADAFDRYVQLTEAQMDSEAGSAAPFLWLDRQPPERRAELLARARNGEVVIERLETKDHGAVMAIPEGMIHHWIGTVFIPGATLEQTLMLEEDYDHHQDYFHPDVQRSRILRHDGNDFLVFFRFRKKKVITSILDTEHEIHYQLLSSARAASRSRTTRIQEVENAGEKDEALKPAGHDNGFLWRMYTYWRFEERDGGTYVESQSISLTRDIPAGLGWMIGPFVTGIPRESLTFTLATTRSAVLDRMAKTKARAAAR